MDMQSFSVWICVFGMILVVSGQGCDPKYKALPNHSACLKCSPSAGSVGVSEAQRKIILEEHNRYRSQVNPTAANMQKMTWDADVAMVAQKWACSCPSGLHDAGHARRIPGKYSYVGQNSGRGYRDWKTVIASWHSEVADFTYGQSPPAGKVVGHYTQIVWATSSKIGCGYAICGTSPIYICNYAPGGNLGSSKRPYQRGASCASCPSKCSKKLCDCGRKVCFNGGTLNMATCGCKCKQPFHVGNSCSLDCSKAVDSWPCGSFYTPSKCFEWANVPDECPNMCKNCLPKSGK